jgi:hypothetical protein
MIYPYNQKQKINLTEQANQLMVSLHEILYESVGKPDKEISFITHSDIEELREILFDMDTVQKLTFMR